MRAANVDRAVHVTIVLYTCWTFVRTHRLLYIAVRWVVCWRTEYIRMLDLQTLLCFKMNEKHRFIVWLTSVTDGQTEPLLAIARY